MSSQTFTDGVPAAGGGNSTCITYNEVITYLDECGLPVDVCGSQAKVEDNLEEALELIETITATKWCPETRCYEFKGSGDCYLYWNFQNSTALKEATTVSINDVSTDLDTFVIHPHHIQILDSKFKCCDTVKVCGEWGVTIPKNIKKGIILLALEYSSPGITNISKVQEATRITWEDFSIDYSDKIREEFGFTTGYSEIDRLIYPFIPTISQINFTSIDNNCIKKCCHTESCTCQS